MTDSTEFSALSHLESSTWSDDQAVSYEVAQDLISQVVAHYTKLIWDERRADTPDTEAVDRLTESRAAWVHRQRVLRSNEIDEIARTTHECRALVKRFTDAG